MSSYIKYNGRKYSVDYLKLCYDHPLKGWWSWVKYYALTWHSFSNLADTQFMKILGIFMYPVKEMPKYAKKSYYWCFVAPLFLISWIPFTLIYAFLAPWSAICRLMESRAMYGDIVALNPRKRG